MPWQSLGKTLSTKPNVLAGPLLRETTPRSVTVWLALRNAANVKLTVFDAAKTVLMGGSRHTVAIGTQLHIVAVTAELQIPMADLAEGVVYLYDAEFDYDLPVFARNPTLATATANALLAYPPFDRPSFCMPPKDVNSLRLMHGSCRMPHGNGTDNLALLDDLIAQTSQTPLQRPHQLLLTGDQIYADDVASSLLVMLTDASNVLLGWKETLPVPAAHGGPRPADKVPPQRRRPMLTDAEFTSEDLDAHLMALGEYLCMYLFVWSDVLWTKDTIPTFADVNLVVTQNNTDPAMGPFWEQLGIMFQPRIEGDIADLVEFRSAVPAVRRALANIPSYMILDDHERTDDWNMTLDICRGIYGNELGRRVIQNGLVAYALCQHWGNVPAQFDASDTSQPGTQLLQLLDKGDAAAYDTHTAAIRTLVGVHTGDQIAAKGAVFHDAGALTYNYSVEGPGHQVIVTDTRTWRAFPRGGGEAPDLLPADQFVQQIGNAPATEGRALLTVITTNAPPVASIRSATRHDWIANHARHFPDIHEAWDLPSPGLDRLMKALSEKLPLVGGERHGPLILLSGDVHTSFASRMLYKASARFEDTTPQPVTAVIAQLVASSLRKQTDETLGEDREGYSYAPHWYLSPIIGPHVTEYYAGYNVPRDSGMEIGVLQAGSRFAISVSLKDASSVQVYASTIMKKTPAFIYQLDYLGITKGGVVPKAPQPLPALPAGATPDERKQAARAYNVATGNYRQYNIDGGGTRQIVGMNNLGEVTFDWPAGDLKHVIHTARWRSPYAGQPALFVDYAVSLDPNDVAFPYNAKVFAV